jgi:hypothetical protein
MVCLDAAQCLRFDSKVQQFRAEMNPLGAPGLAFKTWESNDANARGIRMAGDA